MFFQYKTWMRRLAVMELIVFLILIFHYWSAEYRIGIYNFPGRKDSQRGALSLLLRERIKLHELATLRYDGERALSDTFAEFDLGYRDQWEWTLKNASRGYSMPMGSVLDMPPWSGSGDPGYDNSISTSVELAQHLLAARVMLDLYPEKIRTMVGICCLNELGKRDLNEPTKNESLSNLEKVRKIFSTGTKPC